ncbi:MAG: hypothetical protein OXU20_06815 [Myxococcales bacterium]|nr:hypothetical protein [Myxococcales bacterium]MDD9972280.1 hypothetical protein [Myxococcales bacterium]
MSLKQPLRLAAVGALLLAAFAMRVVNSASVELERGQAYEAESDPVSAIVHYRRAVRWYAPLSPFHKRALIALARIGAQAELDGDSELALSAYRAIRSGILSTRSFYTPETRRLAAANARIADLMAAAPPPPIDAGKSREALRREHLALLQQDNAPHVGWTFVLLAGFATWVFGAFMFSSRALDENERYIPTQVRRWGAVIAVGLCLFFTGLALA